MSRETWIASVRALALRRRSQYESLTAVSASAGSFIRLGAFPMRVDDRRLCQSANDIARRHESCARCRNDTTKLDISVYPRSGRDARQSPVVQGLGARPELCADVHVKVHAANG